MGTRHSRGRAIFEISVDADHARFCDYARSLLERNLECSFEAQDVVQEAYLQAWRMADHFRGSTNEDFRRWLKAFVRLLSRNFVRRWRRESARLKPFDSSGEEIAEEVEAQEPAPDEALTHRETRQVLLSAFLELTELQYRLVWLVYFESRPVREAGRILGIRRSSAYKCLRRALERLEAILERFDESPHDE